MRVKFLLYAFAGILAASCCPRSEISVDWIEGRMDPVTQRCENTFVIKGIPREEQDWGIWFGLSHLRNPEIIHADGVRLRHIGASLYRIEADGVPSGEDRVLQYRTASVHYNAVGWYPMHLVYQKGEGKPVPVKVYRVTLPPASDGEAVYARNDSVRVRPLEPEDILPRPKSIRALEGPSCSLDAEPSVERVPEDHPAGWYRLTLKEGAIRIEATEDSGERYARTTLALMKEQADHCRPLCIEDWPDFPHRGLMLTLSGSSVSAPFIRQFVDVLDRYKMNVLHLHLTDDGGWRLDVPGIPELVTVGARKGLPRRLPDGFYEEDGALMTGKEGCYDASDDSHPNNGWLTREDYVSIVRYAASKGITVLPEIDFPAHSQAVIVALKEYERRTGDTQWRPLESWEISDVASVHGYRGNTWDISLPSTYRFMSKVFLYLKELHEEAGQPLHIIHVGGDEVPEGTWDNSEGCRRLVAAAPKDQPAATVLQSYYVNRMLDVAAQSGLKVCGWHELAAHLDGPTRRRLAEESAWIDFWGRERMLDIARGLLDDGYRVVMCNCEKTYMDNMFSNNKEENGNGWCGPTDDRKAWSLRPLEPDVRHTGRILGVQAQNWVSAEARVCRQMFPKVTAVFDRCWNAEPVCDYDSYFSTVTGRELPWLSRKGLDWHLPQPGLHLDGDTLRANSPIPGAEIRYILSQGTPDAASTLWEGPVVLDSSVKTVSARLYFDGKESVTTTLRR